MPEVKLTLKQKRCQNCIALAAWEEIWYCDEKQKPVEQVEVCPEGVEIPQRNMQRGEKQIIISE